MSRKTPQLLRSGRDVHAVELVVEELHDAVLAVLHHVAIQALQLVRGEHAARHVLVELDHGRLLHDHEVDRLAGGRLGVAELGVAALEVDLGVEADLRHLNDAREALEHAVGAVRVRVGEVVQDALERGRDEQDAAAQGHLLLVHGGGYRAQVLQDVLGVGGSVALGFDGDAGVARDLREGEGVGLRGHLRALELCAGFHEAVDHASLLDVHDISEKADAAVVVEGLGLELVGDGAGLVAHVAGVVAETGDGDLRDEDLLGVVPGADHAAAGVEHARDGRPLVYLVDHRGVVACEYDAVARHGLALFLLVVFVGEASDLAAQLLSRLGVLGCLGHLGLQGCDLLVALCDLLLVVWGLYLRLALLLRFLLLLALLLRRVLRTLRGFLAAIGLTVHVLTCLSSRKAGRDEQCPHLYRYGHRRSVSQVGWVREARPMASATQEGFGQQSQGDRR